MKKIFPWIIFLAIAGFSFGWVYVIHSDPYQAGLAWIRRDPVVIGDVGIIKHVYPDISRYRVSSSDGLSQAHFSLFVYGDKKTDRVELFVQKENSGWHVVRANKNGRSLSVE